MKTLVIFGCLIALSMAQRPSFAGTSAKVYPELASRFQDTSNSESASASNSLANRIGETPKTSTTTTTQKTAPGNVDVVNRFNEPPQDHKPYRPYIVGVRKYHASY